MPCDVDFDTASAVNSFDRCGVVVVRFLERDSTGQAVVVPLGT
jgi:hypothetical protein